MLGSACEFVPDLEEEYYTLEDYASNTPRWCPGCGDFGILTAVQRLCRDEQLPPEKTVFVSGIGCSSRFPHYMKTYGFHGLHGRAVAIAEGIRLRRPDLHIFVATGDGDLCSIGAGQWIHSIRFNMNMTVLLMDNWIYGLTKNQVSPTTPKGHPTATTPYGAPTDQLNPIQTTLGISNVSFVAQTAEWLPEHMFEVVKAAHNHRGTSFIRVLQRCPYFTPGIFDHLIQNPDNVMMLEHENGVMLSEGMRKTFKGVENHDPLDINRARELASLKDVTPLGILYHNPEVAVYDDWMKPQRNITHDIRRESMEREFDKFAVGDR